MKPESHLRFEALFLGDSNLESILKNLMSIAEKIRSKRTAIDLGASDLDSLWKGVEDYLELDPKHRLVREYPINQVVDAWATIGGHYSHL